jgi:glycosyltransferase involved in cell wall biosynthesis
MALSAIILTKNEEKNIEACLKSASFCDEIIVIDDNSSDKTVAIAKKLGANVISHSLANDFAKQRNFGLSQATSEWVLFLDADERISKELQKEIIQVTKKESKISGYYIKRLDFMWGRFLQHGETGDLYFLRLAKKTAGKWVGKVHESWVSTQPTSELRETLLHYPHINMQEFLREINFYSTLRAQELFDQKQKTSVFQIIFYPTGKFFINYILKLGFLDGTPGLIFAICMSFHSFLARGKLWQLWENSSK